MESSGAKEKGARTQSFKAHIMPGNSRGKVRVDKPEGKPIGIGRINIF